MFDAERASKYPSLPPSYFVQEKVVTLLKLFLNLFSFCFFWAHLLCMRKSGGHSWTGVLPANLSRMYNELLFSLVKLEPAVLRKAAAGDGRRKEKPTWCVDPSGCFLLTLPDGTSEFLSGLFILFSSWLTLSGYSKTLDQVKKLRCSKRILSCWKFIVRFAT